MVPKGGLVVSGGCGVVAGDSPVDNRDRATDGEDHQKYTLHNWKAKVLCCLYGITELASPLPPSRSLASIIAALSSYHITVINK